MSAHTSGLEYVTFKSKITSKSFWWKEMNMVFSSQLEHIANIFNVLILFQMCLFGLCGALLQADQPWNSSSNQQTNPLAIISVTTKRRQGLSIVLHVHTWLKKKSYFNF